MPQAYDFTNPKPAANAPVTGKPQAYDFSAGPTRKAAVPDAVKQPFVGSTPGYLDRLWTVLDQVEAQAAPQTVFKNQTLKRGEGFAAKSGDPLLAYTAHVSKVLVDEMKGAPHILSGVGHGIEDIPASVKDAFKSSADFTLEGGKQALHPLQHWYNEPLGDVKAALGVGGMVISPLTGTVDALVGKPQARTLERDIPPEYVRTLAQIVTPVGGFNKAAVSAFKLLPAAAKMRLFGESWDLVFNPHEVSAEAVDAGNAIRQEHALRAMKEEQVQQDIHEASKEASGHELHEHGWSKNAMADYVLGFFGDAMNFASEKVRTGFIHALETGDLKEVPEKFHGLAGKLSQVFADNRKMIENLGVDEKVNWLENYFPHLWKDPEAARAFAKQYVDQMMNASGEAGFLKDRTLDLFREGLDAGLEPVSTNPILLTLIRTREVMRYTMANRVLRSFNDRGLAQWVEHGEPAPEDFVRLDDKIAKARFKDINPYYKTLHGLRDDASDKLRVTSSETVLNRWVDAAKGKPNVVHLTIKRGDLEGKDFTTLGERPTVQGKGDKEFLIEKKQYEKDIKRGYSQTKERDGAWYVHKDADRLLRRYFMPGLFEKQNMVGSIARGLRMVNNLYNQAQLGFSLFHLGFVTLDSMASNTALVAKLIASKSFRRASEVMSETPFVPATYAVRGHRLMSAYRHAVLDTVDAKSEVSSIMGGFVKGSTKNLKRKFVRHLQNETTYTKSKTALADIKRAVEDRRRAGKGGVGGTITDEDLAREIQENYAALPQATRDHLEAIAKPGENIINTLNADSSVRKHLNAYGPIGRGDPELDRLEALLSAGAIAKRPKVYSSRLGVPWQEEFRNARAASGLGSVMQRALRTGGSAFRGTIGAIGAAEDNMMAVLFQHYVPRMKLGVFTAHAQAWLEKNPSASYAELSTEMGKIWDSVENRLGEMDLDRRFWNQTVKDTAVIGLRAVGWNYGTAHEIGGGGVDVKQLVTKGKMTYRTAYLFGLAAETATLGSMLTYINTGHGPTELKDYFFPPDGQGGRMAPPTYAKEIYETPMHPFDTMGNKLGPLWSNLYDTLVTDQDFYGGEVYHRTDGLGDRLKETMNFWLTEFLPFSMQSYTRATPYQEGESRSEYAAKYLLSPSEFGFVKAPKYVERGEELTNKIIESKDKRAYGKAIREGRMEPP